MGAASLHASSCSDNLHLISFGVERFVASVDTLHSHLGNFTRTTVSSGIDKPKGKGNKAADPKPEEAEKENQPQEEEPTVKPLRGKAKGNSAKPAPKNKKQALANATPPKSKPASAARPAPEKAHIIPFSPHPSKSHPNGFNPSDEEEDEEVAPPPKKVRHSPISRVFRSPLLLRQQR
eukprot:60067-Prorocentrum_minimum.AAC.5